MLTTTDHTADRLAAAEKTAATLNTRRRRAVLAAWRAEGRGQFSAAEVLALRAARLADSEAAAEAVAADLARRLAR